MNAMTAAMNAAAMNAMTAAMNAMKPCGAKPAQGMRGDDDGRGATVMPWD